MFDDYSTETSQSSLMNPTKCALTSYPYHIGWLFIAMVVAIPFAAKASDEDLDFFREHYPAAAQRHLDLLKNTVLRLEVYTPSRDKGSRQRVVTYKCRDQDLLVDYWYEEELQKFKEAAKKTLVFGPIKAFRVQRNEDGSFKAIAARPREEMDGVLASVAADFFKSFTIFGITDIVAQERVGRIQLVDAERDGNNIRLSYSVAGQGPSRQIGTSLHNIERDWRIESTEFRVDSEVASAIQLEYEDDASGRYALRRAVKRKSRNGPIASETLYEVISTEAPAAEEFTLNHYGLPATLGDRPDPARYSRPRDYLSIAFVFMAVASAFGYVYLRRKWNA